MKRVLLLIKVFAIILFSGISIQGVGQTPGVQSVVKEIDNTGNIYTQQIEVLKTDKTIILSQSFDQSHFDFYLVDENSNIVNQVSIPGQYIVKEFEILDNVIYFCGSIIAGGLSDGFIAKAKVQDLFTNAYFNWDIIQTTSIINKIEVYRDNIKQELSHIVGIGLDKIGQYIFVHCNELNNWNYTLYKSTYITEYFDDILLKEDYSFPPSIFQNIFIVGRYNNGQRIVVRKFDMYNISNSENYWYDINTNFQKTASYPLVADSLIYKWIAVAGIVQDINGFEETNIYQIDIFGQPNAPAFAMYQIQSYGNYNIGQAKIRDLMFDGTDIYNYNLLVLEDAVPSSQSNLLNSIYLLNMFPNISVPYQADVLYSEIGGINYPFNCLSSFSYYNFIATSIYPNNNNINIWNANRNALGGNCNFLIQEPINVVNFDEMNNCFFTNIPPLNNIYNNYITWNIEQVIMDDKSTNTICN